MALHLKKQKSEHYQDTYLDLAIALKQMSEACIINPKEYAKRANVLALMKQKIQMLASEEERLNLSPSQEDLPVQMLLNPASSKQCQLFYANLIALLKEILAHSQKVRRLVDHALGGFNYIYGASFGLAKLKRILLAIENKERLLRKEHKTWDFGMVRAVCDLAKIDGKVKKSDLSKIQSLFYAWERRNKEIEQLKRQVMAKEEENFSKAHFLFQSQRKLQAYNPFMNKWF